jgi:tRNA (mo5U34)-methyltransferase
VAVTTVTAKTKRLSITADVPEPVLRRARSLKAKLRPRDAQVRLTDTGPRGVIVRPPPPLNLAKRDPQSAVAFLRDVKSRVSPRPGAESNGAPPDGIDDELGDIWWYHTLELPNAVTPGAYDHRSIVPHYGIPEDLSGKRVLDVATFDGFWAFEFERRGGDVTAIDLSRWSDCDFPPQARDLVVNSDLDRRTGAGFALAHEALGSKVSRRECSVYGLHEALGETFDLVHVGDLLLHLERPLDALRSIRKVTAGEAILTDCFDPALAGTNLTHYMGGWSTVTWWLPSLDTLAQMVVDAGFGDVQVGSVYKLETENGESEPWRAVLHARP